VGHVEHTERVQKHLVKLAHNVLQPGNRDGLLRGGWIMRRARDGILAEQGHALAVQRLDPFCRSFSTVLSLLFETEFQTAVTMFQTHFCPFCAAVRNAVSNRNSISNRGDCVQNRVSVLACVPQPISPRFASLFETPFCNRNTNVAFCHRNTNRNSILNRGDCVRNRVSVLGCVPQPISPPLFKTPKNHDSQTVTTDDAAQFQTKDGTPGSKSAGSSGQNNKISNCGFGTVEHVRHSFVP
jgi:hypothetical protein